MLMFIILIILSEIPFFFFLIGAIAIAEYLPETSSLIHLDLTANPDIDIAGVMALAVSIKMNHSVCVLDVNVQVGCLLPCIILYYLFK